MRPLLLGAIALVSWPALVRADAPGPEPAPGRVAIHRGEIANVPPAIPILRGSSAMGLPPLSASQPAAPAVASGGKNLWLVDPATGTLTACRLRATTQIGVERIVCVRRDLP